VSPLLFDPGLKYELEKHEFFTFTVIASISLIPLPANEIEQTGWLPGDLRSRNDFPDK
jgi:hypothetical protein